MTNQQSNVDLNYLFGLQSKEGPNCSLESDVDLDSDWWKDNVNIFADIATTNCNT